MYYKEEPSHFICPVYFCPKRMRSLGINGEEELRGQPANPGSPGIIGR